VLVKVVSMLGGKGCTYLKRPITLNSICKGPKSAFTGFVEAAQVLVDVNNVNQGHWSVLIWVPYFSTPWPCLRGYHS
jgi:hypothetical protein